MAGQCHTRLIFSRFSRFCFSSHIIMGGIVHLFLAQKVIRLNYFLKKFVSSFYAKLSNLSNNYPSLRSVSSSSSSMQPSLAILITADSIFCSNLSIFLTADHALGNISKFAKLSTAVFISDCSASVYHFQNLSHFWVVPQVMMVFSPDLPSSAQWYSALPPHFAKLIPNSSSAGMS